MPTPATRRLCALAPLLALHTTAGLAAASLTLLSGPQQGTHTGNLVTNGSFEIGAPPPNAFGFFWATGTSSAPFAVPTGWSSAGGPSNYARWYSTGTGPYQTNFSANLPDGAQGLYFGNLTTTIDQAPTWNANGTVSFPAAPNFSPVYNQPVRLWQSVPTNTNIAPAYILSFWVSGEDTSSAQWTDGLFGLRVSNVLPGDPIQYLATPGGQTSLGSSIRFEYQFTPINPSLPVTVEFLNWGHINGYPGSSANLFTTELVLDDVIVNAIPAPATAPLAAAALLLASRRRRNPPR